MANTSDSVATTTSSQPSPPRPAVAGAGKGVGAKVALSPTTGVATRKVAMAAVPGGEDVIENALLDALENAKGEQA